MKATTTQEKRKVRGYKITDTSYRKAMKRAVREKVKLAQLIEKMVVGYGEGSK